MIWLAEFEARRTQVLTKMDGRLIETGALIAMSGCHRDAISTLSRNLTLPGRG
jgi:hypothetical protein